MAPAAKGRKKGSRKKGTRAADGSIDLEAAGSLMSPSAAAVVDSLLNLGGSGGGRRKHDKHDGASSEEDSSSGSESESSGGKGGEGGKGGKAGGETPKRQTPTYSIELRHLIYTVCKCLEGCGWVV